jgi:hypothetical protein
VDTITGYPTNNVLPYNAYCGAGNGAPRLNYLEMQIYHRTDQFDTDSCNKKYAYYNISESALTFTTGVCYQTEIPGVYRMTECDGAQYQGGTYSYSDNTCGSGRSQERYSSQSGAYNGSYTSTYDTSCELLYQPRVGYADWVYQRLDKCVVNGIDEIMPSRPPTNMPTAFPSFVPSAAPVTATPTRAPFTPSPTDTPTTGSPTSPSPTTAYPSATPTSTPTTGSPTSGSPTSDPTLEPTRRPSKPPTRFRGVSVGSIALDHLTTIYIVFGVIAVFYFFICLYIWCNERRKRKQLVGNYQKGKDRAARMAWLREKKQQQQRVQMQQQFQQRPEQYDRAHAVQSVDEQFMTEGVR